MISGYFLFQNFKVSAWPEKMTRRIKRLLVPYLAWNVLFLVFYLALAHFVPRLGARVEAFGLNTVEGAFSKIFSFTVAPIDGPLWFIRALFLYALASPLIWALMRPFKGFLVLSLSLAWCVAEPLLGFSDALHLTAPAYSVACFIIGGALTLNRKDIIAFFASRWWLVVGISVCLIRAVIVMSKMSVYLRNKIPPDLFLSLSSIIEAPALVCLLPRLKTDAISSSGIYKFFSRMSFFAYAGHFLFCSIWLHSLAPMFSRVGSGKFTMLILVFMVFGIGSMAVVYKTVGRLCPRLMKTFDGTL